MGETLDLGFELDDFLAVCVTQRLDELTDLLHLQPQVGAQHDQVVKA